MKRNFPKHPGVYAIRHVASGKMYIGSARNIYGRWRTHRSLLRRGLHHSPHLQNSWDKYGEPAFVFEVLEACLGEPVTQASREQSWLDRTPRRKLFNIAKNADPAFGVPQSPENKAIVSERMKGNRNGAGHHYCGCLTEADIPPILERFATGEHAASIAKDFDVTSATISRIGRRSIWQNVVVSDVILERCRLRLTTCRQGIKCGRAKLDDDKVREIRRRAAAGESWASLSREFGLSSVGIRYVAIRRSWAHVPD